MPTKAINLRIDTDTPRCNIKETHTIEEYKRVISIIQGLKAEHSEYGGELDVAIMCVDFRNKLENYISVKEQE